MSIDYQYIAYQDVAQIRKIDIFNGDLATLDITGKGFVDVSAVRINGVDSPEFVVLSSTRVLAQIPSSQRNAGVQDLVVLTARSGSSQSTILSFEAIAAGRVAEGLVKLVQTYIKLLLTTPGTDLYRPRAGGGLYSLVGSVTDREGTSVRAKATIAVTNTTNQVLAMQSGDSRLTNEERLQSATLLGLSFDPASSTLSLRIRLQSMTGASADANLSL